MQWLVVLFIFIHNFKLIILISGEDVMRLKRDVAVSNAVANTNNKLAVVPVLVLIIIAIALSPIGTAGVSVPVSTHIYASQIGYGIGDKKIAVVVSPGEQTFGVVNVDTNIPEYSGTLKKWGTSWTGSGKTGVCYVADFSDFKTPGTYKLVIGESESYPFSISRMAYDLYDQAMLFFTVQRCGVAVPGWHGVCHADDATLNGAQIDVRGGWHDAGDYNKYMGNTPYAAYILLRAYETDPDLWHDRDDNGLPDILDEVRVALDWMMKMQTPDGSVYERVYSGYGYWGPPEGETDERHLDTDKDCYITAKHAFAMALASRIYQNFDPVYARKCEESAIKAYEWAVNNPQQNPVNSYGGGLYPGHECAIALAALELYNVTGEDQYMENAEKILNDGLKHSDTSTGTESPSTWDKQWSLAEFRYLNWGTDEKLKQEIFDDLKKLIGANLQRAETDPYGISTYALNWGVGIDGYLCGMAIDSLLMYRETDDVAYLSFATDQVQWIFGVNPFNLCFITGKGSKYPVNVHYRLDRIIPGGMVLGAYGEPPRYVDDKNQWQYNEYAIDTQAQLVLATALLSKLEFSPEHEPPTVQIISPTEKEVVSASTTITVKAADNMGIHLIQYRVDGGDWRYLEPSWIGDMYSARWNTTEVANGPHTIELMVCDASGNKASSSVSVSVTNEVKVKEKCHVEVFPRADDAGNTNIRVRFYNDGTTPLTGVSIRYVLNVSELPHGVDDVGVEGPWCGAGVLKGPIQYHGDVYYFELSFNKPVEPGTFVEESWMMFDRDNWDNWNSGNDWSAQWEQMGQWYLDTHIPAYQNGNLICGYEPNHKPPVSQSPVVTPFENLSTPITPTGEKPLISSPGFVMICIAVIIAILIRIKRKGYEKA